MPTSSSTTRAPQRRRTIVVTGASRGIGAATARAFARADASHHLVLVARSQGELATRAEELRALGSTADVLCADLSERASREAFIKELLSLHGETLYGVVLNAGVAFQGDFLTQSPEDQDLELELNYRAPLDLLRGLLPSMRSREGAFLVAVSSLTALLPFPGHATYSASKGAIAALMRSLAAEYAQDPVHLGVVLPGYTETAMTAELESLMSPMSADQVAEAIVKSVTSRDAITIPGSTNSLAALAFQMFPSLSYRALARLGSRLVPSLSEE